MDGVYKRDADTMYCVNETFFIVGPTAVGKTSLAIELAEQFDAEIVNADAFQIYCGLDILNGETGFGSTTPGSASPAWPSLVSRDNVGGKIWRTGVRGLGRYPFPQEKRDHRRRERALPESDHPWIR